VFRSPGPCVHAARVWIDQTIAQSAHGFDPVIADFLAQPPDKHLDRIGIAVEILI